MLATANSIRKIPEFLALPFRADSMHCSLSATSTPVISFGLKGEHFEMGPVPEQRTFGARPIREIGKALEFRVNIGKQPRYSHHLNALIISVPRQPRDEP